MTVRELWDLAHHRYIWSGDKIRLYSYSGSFRGEYRVSIEGIGFYGVVRLKNGNPATAIRRDLPRWNGWFKCWTYQYEE